MQLSAQEAARMLGVSRMQISRLVASGELKSERFGNALQIDLDSLQRYRDLRPARGRPLRPDSAWRRLLEPVESFRAPLDLEDVKLLAIEVRRRAHRREMRALPGSVDAVLGDRSVVVTGAGAAVDHGAAVQDRPPHQVYVRESDLEPLAKRHRLRDVASDANLIVRVAPDDADLFEHGRVAPLLVAIVDLVDERDDRSAAEALREFA
jgi:excisionase family DNA binding protein